MELAEARRLAQESLSIQEVEIADGFSSGNPVLHRLSVEVEPSDLLELVHELRGLGVAERQLSARLMKESVLSAEQVLVEVRPTLSRNTNVRIQRRESV